MPPQNWTLNGNGGTNPPGDFLGTTDNQSLVLKTNGTEAVRIDPLGKVAIGTPTPDGKLHVVSGESFRSPQVIITQTTPLDFARLQFRSFTRDIDPPFAVTPLPLWDIAAGRGVLNFFRQDTGNVMTLTSGQDPGASTLRARVGIGTENPQTALHVNGTATVGILQITDGNDIAEPFPVEQIGDIEPGTVMVIDDEHPGKLKISHSAHDHKVAGIVSGAASMHPGLVLAPGGNAANGSIVALTGRVYCKAEAMSCPIEPGDLLTTSNIPGHAMRVCDHNAARGAILGKSMAALESGRGLLLILVSLQ
jgi:hypothetical protein